MPTRLLADLALVLRTARRRPALLVLSTLTVMLVVGAGSAVFAVANATLVRPLPFHDPDRLARIYLLPPGITDTNLGANPLHPLDLVRLRERLTLATGPEGLWARERGIGGDGPPESVPAAGVTPGFFGILGAAPALGRVFTADEDHTSAPVVLISHGLWTRRFGADPAAIGQTMTIDRVRHEIIGVMPAGFEPAYARSELWTPLGIHAGNLILPAATFIQNVVRLKPGVTLGQLDAEVKSILAEVEAESPATLNGWRSGVRSVREAQFGPQESPLTLLIIAIGLLAVIAVANLMNLTFTRVMSRRPETSLRLALGARTWDLVRTEIVDACVIAGLGGLAGLAVAHWLLPAILALDPVGRVALGQVSIDWRVLAATFALSFAVTLVSGVVPTLRAVAGRRAATLQALGKRSTEDAGTGQARAFLVVAETALAFVLLSSAVLVYRAFDATAEVAPGFDARNTIGTQLRLSESAHASPESRTALLGNLLEAVRAAPGVVDAATTMNLLVPGAAYVTIAHPTETPMPGETGHTVQFRRISDGYFRTMRIPIEAGRDFDAHDTLDTEPVVIVSRRFVDAYLGDGNPIGRRIRRGLPTNKPSRIVGVVGDVRDVGYGQEAQPTLYTAYRQGSTTSAPLSLIVRTARDSSASVGAIATAVWSVDPALPLSKVVELEAFLSDSLGSQRFRSVLLAVFAGLGLLVASVGIYGVTARSVVERTREVGVRLALGGSPGGVWRSIAQRPLGAVVAGAIAGTALSLFAAHIIAAYLPGTTGPAVSALWPAAAVLVATGGLAAVVPAYRATRIDPLRALRSE